MNAREAMIAHDGGADMKGMVMQLWTVNYLAKGALKNRSRFRLYLLCHQLWVGSHYRWDSTHSVSPPTGITMGGLAGYRWDAI